MHITATNIRKSYGPVTALDGLSLEIPAGTTYGILGTNGAGKTTLFELLVGHDVPDSGELTVGPYVVEEAGPAVRRHVGYLPERMGFPDRLTGREVLHFQARMRELPLDGRIDDAFDIVGLSASAVDRSVGGYSNGMRRRLGLAAALLPEPSILVLDEPTAGLDPCGVAELHEILDEIRAETDATVVVTSHVLSEVERLCDHVAILHDGRLQVSGAVPDLVERAETTVRLESGAPGDVGTLADRASEIQQVSTVTVEDDYVSVHCSATDLPKVYAALVDVPLAETAQTRTGLEQVFHDAIDGSEVVA